jgi:hypothetical protein
MRVINVLLGQLIYGRFGLWRVAERIASAIVWLLRLGGHH